MSSALFHAQVTHARLWPTKHSFEYPVYMYAFDLDTLPTLDKEHWYFGYNSFRPITVRDSDYLHEEDGSIREKLYRALEQKGIATTDIGRIELFTSARYFGYIFNPVSFFICYRQNGDIYSVVAEVNNTFRERHLYVLSDKDILQKDERGYVKVRKPKSFHVSPFNDMLGSYEFTFQRTEGHLDMRVSVIRKDVTRDSEKMAFTGRIVGNLSPLTDRNVYKTLLRYPFTAWLTYPRILIQAAKLYFLRRLKVYTKPHPISADTIVQAPTKLSERIAQHVVTKLFRRIQFGSLEVHYPDGKQEVFAGHEHIEEKAVLKINHNRFFRAVAFGGDVGFGESYMLGDWESPDTTQLLKLFLKNRSSVDPRTLFVTYFMRKANWFLHTLRKNTLFGSKKNIQDHYDLSNDMFQTFLDKTMSYSCALYKEDSDTLEEAQLHKIDRIIDQADLKPEDHVLEIGCGWGSLAMRAVHRTGCRFTCLTLSEEQKAYAEERIRESGLEDRITVLLQDYRSIEGTFDKIISIEMIEAVGREFLDKYFQSCERLLKKDGKIVIQAITMPDTRIKQYNTNCDWIQKYIFPGCYVPSIELLQRTITRSTNLSVEDLFSMETHYERTLATWREEFRKRMPKVTNLGFDMNFIRKWMYYFSYCEAGFDSKVLNTYQIVLKRS